MRQYAALLDSQYRLYLMKGLWGFSYYIALPAFR